MNMHDCCSRGDQRLKWLHIQPDRELREPGHCIRLEHDDLFGTDETGWFYGLARAPKIGGGYYYGRSVHKWVYAHFAYRGTHCAFTEFEVRHDLIAIFCMQMLSMHSIPAKSLQKMRPSALNAAEVSMVACICMNLFATASCRHHTANIVACGTANSPR